MRLRGLHSSVCAILAKYSPQFYDAQTDRCILLRFGFVIMCARKGSELHLHHTYTHCHSCPFTILSIRAPFRYGAATRCNLVLVGRIGSGGGYIRYVYETPAVFVHLDKYAITKKERYQNRHHIIETIRVAGKSLGVSQFIFAHPIWYCVFPHGSKKRLSRIYKMMKRDLAQCAEYTAKRCLCWKSRFY